MYTFDLILSVLPLRCHWSVCSEPDRFGQGPDADGRFPCIEGRGPSLFRHNALFPEHVSEDGLYRNVERVVPQCPEGSIGAVGWPHGIRYRQTKDIAAHPVGGQLCGSRMRVDLRGIGGHDHEHTVGCAENENNVQPRCVQLHSGLFGEDCPEWWGVGIVSRVLSDLGQDGTEGHGVLPDIWATSRSAGAQLVVIGGWWRSRW